MKILDLQTGIPQKVNPDDAGGEFEGLPFTWLRDNKLSSEHGFERGVASADPDVDGFTNLEEYKWKTDPNDPDKHPDWAVKLRVKELRNKPFDFMFVGVQGVGEGVKYTVRSSKTHKDYYVSMGGKILDQVTSGYIVTNYSEKYQEEKVPGIKQGGKDWINKVNVSELTVQKEGEKPIVLVRGKPGETEELYAVLIYLLELDPKDSNKKREINTNENPAFSLKDIPYQVISVKKLDGSVSEVVVERTDTKEKFTLLNQ